MRNIRLVVFAVLGFMLLMTQGCMVVSDKLIRTYEPTDPTSYPPAQTDHPAINERTTAEVGESLVWKSRQRAIPAVQVEEDVLHPTENLGRKFVITLPAGEYQESGHDSSGRFFRGFVGSILIDGLPLKDVDAGLYVSDLDSNKTEIYVLPADRRPLSYARDGIPFTRIYHHLQDKQSFKRELVYTGVSKNVIFILYREFKDDFARPAFSQELKYDLSESRVVGFRGARLEIFEATNQGITYRVLKHLD